MIGGVGATLHGSPLPTRDADICPAGDAPNLETLAAVLREMGARIRTSDTAEGLPFSYDAAFLRQMKLLNLTTRFGDLELSFEPSGTAGTEDLSARAVAYDLGEGLQVRVASLEDIIRSKEAANREKVRQTLPTLRLFLERFRKQGPGAG